MRRGGGSIDDLEAATEQGGASAVAAGSMFVYKGIHRAVLINYPDRQTLTEIALAVPAGEQFGKSGAFAGTMMAGEGQATWGGHMLPFRNEVSAHVEPYRMCSRCCMDTSDQNRSNSTSMASVRLLLFRQ